MDLWRYAWWWCELKRRKKHEDEEAEEREEQQEKKQEKDGGRRGWYSPVVNGYRDRLTSELSFICVGCHFQLRREMEYPFLMLPSAEVIWASKGNVFPSHSSSAREFWNRALHPIVTQRAMTAGTGLGVSLELRDCHYLDGRATAVGGGPGVVREARVHRACRRLGARCPHVWQKPFDVGRKFDFSRLHCVFDHSSERIGGLH